MNGLLLLVVGSLISGSLGLRRGRVYRDGSVNYDGKPGGLFADGFKKLIDEHRYKGGATGVLLGDRLGFAEGYGQTVTGHNVRAETIFPASGISKIFTALTVLKLIENGSLKGSDRVFGKAGLLRGLTPKDSEITDKRILKITVDDLLRHAGGWDSEISAIADPVFNEFLVDSNQHITDIKKQLKVDAKDDLNVYDLIKFMATQSLDFEPGTQSRISNLGYVILGRVIEEVTGSPYELVVKDKLLVPCGMWHTKLGPHIQEGHQTYKGRDVREIKLELVEKHEAIGEYYAYVQTYLVDSALGWFSNVYDVMRLAQCIDGSAGYQLLNASSTAYMLAKPRDWNERETNWFGAGFQVHDSGAIWVADETHAPDVVFLHRDLKRHTTGYEYTGDENEPAAWTFMFEGKPQIDAPMKQLSRVMVESETDWPKTNAFVDDVSDRILTLGNTIKLVKMKIDEHRANMYLMALKHADFNVIWINAYTNDDKTFITVIAEKDRKASRECIAQAGLNKDQLVQRKMELQKLGYNMTFFQNYKSFSHLNDYMFLAVFHKGAFRNDTHILYGIQHFDRPYKTLLELYEEKGFRPLVQSIEFKRDDALLSFILEADVEDEDDKDDKKKKDQKSIYSSEDDLSETRLEKYVRKYARSQKRLIYLDASNHRGRPKFSALFKKTRMTKWLFSQGLSLEDMLITVTEKQKEGYLPSVIVGYSTRQHELKFVTYLEKP